MKITDTISIPDSEVRFDFVRSSGPGGQNVNKLATAAQLRFDVAHSASLSERVRGRLMQIARNRINSEGELIIEAKRHRSQEQNREDALDRLRELIRQAASRPKPRRRTRPTAASRERRLQNKTSRRAIKSMRRRPTETD